MRIYTTNDGGPTALLPRWLRHDGKSWDVELQLRESRKMLKKGMG